VWLAHLCVARAETSGAYLEWRRPPGSTCPPAAALEHDVEQALGRRVFTTARAARLHIRGIIEDGPDGPTVRLEARSLDGKLLGTRELHSQAQCAALRTDIGLVLTLLVEHERDESVPSPALTLRLGAGVWVGLLVNTLPRATFGAGPALTLDLGPYAQLRLDAAYWLPVAIETTDGVRAGLQAASGALRVCPRIGGSEQTLLLLRVCGGLQLGASVATQTSPGPGDPQLRLLVQGVLELRSALRLGRVGRLELALGPVISLHRTSILALRDEARVFLYRPPLVGMILSLAFII
jgi:hypothetical protein